MRVTHKELILKSGKVIKSDGGVIGITLDSGDALPATGHDKYIFESYLTPQEKIELANYAIKLWNIYKIQAELEAEHETQSNS